MTLNETLEHCRLIQDNVLRLKLFSHRKLPFKVKFKKPHDYNFTLPDKSFRLYLEKPLFMNRNMMLKAQIDLVPDSRFDVFDHINVPDGDLENLQIIHYVEKKDPRFFNCPNCTYQITISKTLDTL